MTAPELLTHLSPIVNELATAERIRLDGGTLDVTDGPGAYLLGLGAPDPEGLYAEAVAMGAPLYAGSTCRLRSRLSAHVRKLGEGGLLDAEPMALVLPTAGLVARGHARFVEEALLVALPLAWNHPTGPLWGLGANPQGRRRHAPAAPWWRVHGQTVPDPVVVAAYAAWWEENKVRAVSLFRPPAR